MQAVFPGWVPMIRAGPHPYRLTDSKISSIMSTNTPISPPNASDLSRRRFTLKSCCQSFLAGTVLLLGSAGADATPGDPDQTFGLGGVVLLDANPGSHPFEATAPTPTCSAYQPDGKLLLGGSRNFTIIRYDLAGNLDPTYGGNGKVSIDPNAGAWDFGDGISKVFPQEDGSVIAAGGVSGRMALVKYTNDGVLDLTFDRGGIAISPVGKVSTSNSVQPRFARQADGKIVGATTETYEVNGNNAFRVRLERFNLDGTPDVGFGSGGFVRVPVANTSAIAEVGITPAGKVVVGFADFAVAVFTVTGSLDTSFSGDGYQTVRVDPTNFSQALGGLAIQPDGKILLSGQNLTFTPTFNYHFALARLNTDGSLDTTFSGDGLVTTDLGTSESAASVALQSDGKIIIAGTTLFTASSFVTLRYLANGTLDSSFSTTPVPTYGYSSNTGPPLLTQPNGNVTVSGLAKESAAPGTGGYLTMRFTATGSSDTTFSSDGMVFTQPRGNDDRAWAMAVQPDEKIVLGGSTGLGITVLRTLPDGSLDTSFGGDGRSSLDFGTNNGAYCHSVALQPNGKVVVAGYCFEYNSATQVSEYDFVLGRLLPNGDPDSSFGTGGKVRSHLGGRDFAQSVAIQSDGKILVGGYSNRLGSDRFTLVRYSSNGERDSTFGTDGIVSTSGTTFGYKVLVQPDGKILLGGTGGSGFAVARYLADGTLDASFDGDGLAVAPLPAGGYDGNDMLLQPDGKVIVAGHWYNAASPDPNKNEFAAVRFGANGTLDTGFGTAGRLAHAVGFDGSYCYGAALQTDGKVLMVGQKLNGLDGSKDLVLLRLMSNGTVDGTFGVDGVVTSDFERRDEEGRQITITSNGRILVAGTSRGGTDDDYLLAAFLESSTTVPELVVEQPAGTDLADGGSLDFGACDLGGANTLTFRIRNTGNGPLHLGDLKITGTAAADFTLLRTPYPVIPPGGVSSFIVQFLPSALGSRTAALSFPNNDSSKNPFDISLQATGQEVGVPPTTTLVSNAPSVLPGSSAILTATPTGTQPHTFEWFQGSSGDTSVPLSGSASTLSVSPQATNSYWVRVTNRAGTVNSIAVQVVVILPYPNQGDDNIITNVTGAFADTDMIGEVQTIEVSGTRWVLFVRGGRLYSVPFQGGTPLELTAGIVTPSISENTLLTTLSTGVPRDVASSRSWTVSGNQAFFIAGNARKLYRVPLVGGTPVDLSGATGAVSAFVVSHDGAIAFYRTSHLYRVPVASGAPVQMSSGLSIYRFCFTPNGTHLVFSGAPADLNNAGIYSLPVGATTGTTPLRLNNPNRPTGAGSRQFQEFRVSPTSARVVYRANDEVGTEIRLFSATITSASRVNLMSNPAGNYIVRAFSISPDGNRVAFHAKPGNLSYRMYSVPIAGGAMFTIPYAGDGFNFDNQPVFTPDSLKVLAAGDFPTADDVARYGFDFPATEFALFNAASAGYTQINSAPPNTSTRFATAELVPAGGGVVYRQSPTTFFSNGAFLKAANLSGGEQRVLDGTLLNGLLGNWSSGAYQISETGQRVLFVKFGDRNNEADLYSSAINNGAIRRLHPAVTTHSFQIQRYGSVGDGNSAWMIGNYASSGREDLIFTRMPAPTLAVFLSQPVSSTINQNQSVTLSVTMQGTGPITYQWYQGESGVTTNPISGATSASYTTPSLAGTQFSYWVRATNPVGSSDSSTAVITLNQPPSITTQPVSGSILEGDNVALSVVAAGTGTLSYQWYRGPAGNVTDPVGINSATLSHGPVTASTSYWVRVSSNFGTADSQTANITLIPRLPAFTSATSTTGTAGNQFAFQITTTNGPNSITCANLPAWLSLDASTGWLTGTPPTVGTFTLDLAATNPYRAAQSTLLLNISPPRPVITSPTMASGRQNDPFLYQITASQNPGSYTSSALPGGLSLNGATGVISGVPSTNGTFNITLGAVNAGGTGNATLSLFIAPPIPPPVILSPMFAAGNVNTALSIQATATNTPTSYSLLNAPSWLSVNAAGLLTGTPTLAGTFNFKLRGSNASGPGAYKDISFQIEPNPQAPTITSQVENRGRKGVAFSFALTTSVPATSFTLVSGSLPAGIAFNPGTGAFSGAPTVTGTFNLVFTATNSFGPGKSSPLRLIMDPPLQVPVISSVASFNLQVGVAFSTTITATNSPTSFTFTNLPGWMTQSGTAGQLSGTPPAPGVFNTTVLATNGDGPGNAQAIVFNVAHHPNAPIVQVPADFTAYQGLPFSTTLQTSPPSTSMTASGLPPGITLNSSARSLGGTPTATGDYTVILQASNADGQGAATTASFKVLPPPGAPEIISSLTEYAKGLEPYSYTILARSDIPVLSYSASGLPTGLSLNATTGAISGTPLEIGTFDLILSASSVVGQGEAKTMVLTIRPGSIVPKITSAASASVVVEQPFSYQIVATNGPITAYSATNLPEGLSLNAVTGLIAGKIVDTGSFDVMLTAANLNGAGLSQVLKIAAAVTPGAPIVIIPEFFFFYRSQPLNYEVQVQGMPPRPWLSGTGVYASSLPPGMSLNASTGVLSGIPQVVSDWTNFRLSIYAVHNGIQSTSRSMTLQYFTAPGSRPIITGPKQLAAQSGQNLNFTITADRACNLWYFGVVNIGLSINDVVQNSAAFVWPASRLGLPGVSTYNAAGYDSSEWGVLAGLPLRIDPAAGAPAITSQEFFVVRTGTAVSASLTASGSPTEFSADFAGNAPSGISLNKTTGQFTGVPSVPGSYSFLARAKNAQGWSLPKFTTLAVLPAAQTAAAISVNAFSLRGFSRFNDETPLAPSARQVGQPMTYSPSYTDGASFFVFSDLPPGLVGNVSTGAISGTPEKPGDFIAKVRPFSDTAVGEEITIPLTILPVDGAPVMSSSIVISGTAGTELTHLLTATPSAVGFNVTDLPDFVIVDPMAGAVSGTPNTPGSYEFTASPFNAVGEGMPVTVKLQIAPAAGTPVVSIQQNFPILQVGVPFSASLTSSPSATFYDGGSLPYGINLDPQTGIISGTPLVPGRSEVPLWGVNSSGQGGSLNLEFDINGAAGTPSITIPSVVRVVGGNGFSLQLASSPDATGYSVSPVPPGLALDPVSGLLTGTLAANATVVVYGSNALGQGTPKEIQLKVFNAPSALWLDEEFGSDATNPSIAGWGASPAGDGISNLLKYSFGLKALVPSSQGLPQPSIEPLEGGNHFVFTIQKNPDATDLVLIPEITSDLTTATWNSGPSHLTLIEETPTRLTVRDNSPLQNNQRRFMRVKATLVSP